MIVFENMIIVGGTGRNIGKTTLAEKLIKKFAANFPVTAVKVANIKRGNENFHGHDVTGFADKICIEKETRIDGGKDSMRFLKAGAAESWFIQTEDIFLPETSPKIYEVLKQAKWVVCESNSLRNYIKPALFIMVRRKESPEKKDISDLLRKADIVVEAWQWEQFDTLVEHVEIRKNSFILMK